MTKVTSDSPYIKSAITKDADRYLVKLTLSKEVPTGEFYGEVTITTTHPNEPIVHVRVRAVGR